MSPSAEQQKKEPKKEDYTPSYEEMRDTLLIMINNRDEKIEELRKSMTMALDLALYKKEYEIASILKGCMAKITGEKPNV